MLYIRCFLNSNRKIKSETKEKYDKKKNFFRDIPLAIRKYASSSVNNIASFKRMHSE